MVRFLFAALAVLVPGMILADQNADEKAKADAKVKTLPVNEVFRRMKQDESAMLAAMARAGALGNRLKESAFDRSKWDDKWIGKRLRVIGTISKFSMNEDGTGGDRFERFTGRADNINRFLRGGSKATIWLTSPASATFDFMDDSEAAKVKGLRKGRRVTIEGTVRSWGRELSLDDCRIISPVPEASADKKAEAPKADDREKPKNGTKRAEKPDKGKAQGDKPDLSDVRTMSVEDFYKQVEQDRKDLAKDMEVAGVAGNDLKEKKFMETWPKNWAGKKVIIKGTVSRVTDDNPLRVCMLNDEVLVNIRRDHDDEEAIKAKNLNRGQVVVIEAKMSEDWRPYLAMPRQVYLWDGRIIYERPVPKKTKE